MSKATTANKITFNVLDEDEYEEWFMLECQGVVYEIYKSECIPREWVVTNDERDECGEFEYSDRFTSVRAFKKSIENGENSYHLSQAKKAGAA